MSSIPLMAVVSALGLSLLSVTILAAATLVRWRMSKSHWEHHPEGGRGHLKDAALITVTFIPVLIGALIMRVGLFANPSGTIPPVLFFGLIIGYVLRIVLGRIAPFAPARQRLTDSRIAALNAKKTASESKAV